MTEKTREGTHVKPRKEIYNSVECHPHKNLYIYKGERFCLVSTPYGITFTHMHLQKFYLFYKDLKHDTKDCFMLKKEIGRLIT
jgi:hypothetical protein